MEWDPEISKQKNEQGCFARKQSTVGRAGQLNTALTREEVGMVTQFLLPAFTIIPCLHWEYWEDLKICIL